MKSSWNESDDLGGFKTHELPKTNHSTVLQAALQAFVAATPKLGPQQPSQQLAW